MMLKLDPMTQEEIQKEKRAKRKARLDTVCALLEFMESLLEFISLFTKH